MVGVHVRLERIAQREAKLGEELAVPLHVLEHRIDEHRVAGLLVGEEVGVGAGGPVEELAEEHGVPVRLDRWRSPVEHAPCHTWRPGFSWRWMFALD